METLGKWLIAAAILCVIGFFSLKDEKGAGKERVYILVLGLILGVLGYNCLSDKSKTHPGSGSHGENIPFGGSHVESGYVSLYSCNAYYARGNFACKVEVKSKDGILYAFPNGETSGCRIENAPYGAPGAYYIYWGSTPIYF